MMSDFIAFSFYGRSTLENMVCKVRPPVYNRKTWHLLRLTQELTQEKKVFNAIYSLIDDS